ncbi:MAG: ABC transporter permease [Verrucomicrobia bacterium]|nr:MAG: ABC transporter permease [Verrucomicrobiota bacterium]
MKDGNPNNEVKSAAGCSLWADAWRQLRNSRLAVLCLWIIGVYAALALYGEGQYLFYHWQDRQAPYNETHLDLQYQPPGTAHHPLGTDGLGRDVGARLIQGVRIAFQVGIVTSLIAIPIGVVLGCLAGYFGGRTDDVIVWLYSTFASIPGLLFILAIAMVVGKGLLGIYLGIGLTTWVNLCRLIRGEVIKHKSRPYVLAARALGLSHGRIIFRHILPNVFHIVIVTFTLRFSFAIGTEVFMSFLGIGVQGEPSWGVMISNARLRLWYGVWWEMTFTTLAIFVIVLAFNLLGDALRDALDPRLRTRES